MTMSVLKLGCTFEELDGCNFEGLDGYVTRSLSHLSHGTASRIILKTIDDD